MSFEDIYEYIKRSKEERQKHLDLKQPCLEIGGHSTNYRGLLSHYLKTTIPLSRKIHLCHACNNGNCSNVSHLYWGTIIENREDSIKSGSLSNSPWDNLVNKYGKDVALEMLRNIPKKGSKAKKTEEHKANISKSLKRHHEDKNSPV